MILTQNIITDFIEREKIKKYQFQKEVISWSEILLLTNDILRAGDDIYIFYDLYISGKILNVASFTNNLLILQSPIDRIDYKKICKFTSYSGMDILRSNSISFHNSDIKFTIGNPNIFQQIIQGHLKYYVLKNIERSE